MIAAPIILFTVRLGGGAAWIRGFVTSFAPLFLGALKLIFQLFVLFLMLFLALWMALEYFFLYLPQNSELERAFELPSGFHLKQVSVLCDSEEQEECFSHKSKCLPFYWVVATLLPVSATVFVPLVNPTPVWLFFLFPRDGLVLIIHEEFFSRTTLVVFV